MTLNKIRSIGVAVQHVCMSRRRSGVRIPYRPLIISTMGKIEKKRLKIQERINFLEDELRMSLTKKTSTTKEIDVASHSRKIQELKIELSKMV